MRGTFPVWWGESNDYRWIPPIKGQQRGAVQHTVGLGGFVRNRSHYVIMFEMSIEQVQTLAYLAVAWQVVVGCYVWNIYANGSVDEHFFGKLWTYNDDSRPVSENMMEALGVFLNSSSPNCSILNQNCAYYHIFSVLLKVTQLNYIDCIRCEIGN